MAKIIAGRNQKFVYGSYAIFSFSVKFLTAQYATPQLTVPLGGDQSAPTAGTITVAGVAVTLTATDILSPQAVCAKIKATAISGWNVAINSNGYGITLTSTTVGVTTRPTVVLGTATKIMFLDLYFTQGAAIPSVFDDIKISGRTPVQVKVVNTAGTAGLESSIGTDDEQASTTLTYTTVTLSSGVATITAPTNYIRVTNSGATQITLYIAR